MHPVTIRRGVLTIALVVAASAAASAQEMPPPPQPGPEHALLKEDAGTWDATVEVFMKPGAPPEVSKGTEVNTIGCGGLCLITDFKSSMMNQPFEGHGVSTWDPNRKKYVGSWTDSMSRGLYIAESTWDPATRTSTGWMEGPDMSGKTTKTKSTVQYKPDGSRVFTTYAPGPDGKETVGMRITYRKRS
jgi:hypothetical protein